MSNEHETGELAVVEDTTAPTNINQLDLVDVDYAVKAQKNFESLVEALLDKKTDYQGGKKKKSAWRKLARAFNISDEKICDKIIRDENHQIISAYFEVKAILPNGRYGIGIGDCSIFDKIKADDIEMPSNFELRKRFTNAEHDVIATAHTRAKSRAIADLIGAGEVGADELEDEHVQVTRSSRNNNNSNNNDDAPVDDAPKRNRRQRRTPKSEPKPEVQEAEVIETTATEVKEEQSSTSTSFEDIDNEAVKKAINRITEADDEVTKSNIIDEIFGLYDMGDITEEEYFEAKKALDA